MFSDSKASISRKEGGRFTTYDGYASGKNLKLTKDREIMQTWRGNDWPRGHYSTVKFTLKRSGSGTES